MISFVSVYYNKDDRVWYQLLKPRLTINTEDGSNIEDKFPPGGSVVCSIKNKGKQKIALHYNPPRSQHQRGSVDIQLNLFSAKHKLTLGRK